MASTGRPALDRVQAKLREISRDGDPRIRCLEYIVGNGEKPLNSIRDAGLGFVSIGARACTIRMTILDQ